MSTEIEKKIEALLIGALSGNFNRTLSALEECGAIETKKLRSKYTGIGSEYYDLVSKIIENCATNSATEICKAIDETKEK